jgi:hypothetical protein
MRHTLRLAGLCLLLLLVFILSTNPQTLPSVLLILPFILVFIFVFLTLLSIGTSRGVMRAKAARVAVFGAALPTLILVLQSLGQLTLRDVLTILVLFCMAYFYMTRFTGRVQG